MRLTAAPAAKRATLIGLGLLPMLIHMALTTRYAAHVASALGPRAVDIGLVAAAAVPHTLVYCGLLAVFGRTLLPGRVALVTALARRMYGTIPDAEARYTRGVTWAWCGFFAAQLGTSLALFLLAPLAAWSFFVGIMNLPLIVLFFAAEQGWRMLRLADAPRHSPREVIRMIGYIGEGLSRRTDSG